MFRIRLGIPDVQKLWDDLNKRERRNTLSGSERKEVEAVVGTGVAGGRLT